MQNKFKQRSTIDTLLRIQSDLIVEKQRIRDKQNEENSRIETQIKELENKAYRLKQVADGKIEDIDRLIKKNQEQMALEAKYYSNLTNEQINKTKNSQGTLQDTVQGV